MRFLWMARLWFWIIGAGFVCLWMLVRFWVEDRVDDLRQVMRPVHENNLIYLDQYWRNRD